MSSKNVYRLVEDFRQLISKANKKQTENIPKEQKNKEMIEIINELESLITPITKELGQKTDKEFLPLQTKFADLLTEYQYLENQYKNENDLNENQKTEEIEIIEPNFHHKIEIYSYDDQYKQNGQNESLQEMQQVDMEDHLTMLQDETRNIVASVRELNEVTELVHNELQNQRHLIHSVEATTAETVETMGKANEDLDKAKRDQSKCRI